eukprot:13317290-Ditylum_brightwellii.AAC.1
MEEVVLQGQLGSRHHFQDNNGFIGYDEDDACNIALTGCTINRDRAAMYCNEDMAYILIDEVLCTPTVVT